MLEFVPRDHILVKKGTGYPHHNYVAVAYFLVHLVDQAFSICKAVLEFVPRNENSDKTTVLLNYRTQKGTFVDTGVILFRWRNASLILETTMAYPKTVG